MKNKNPDKDMSSIAIVIPSYEPEASTAGFLQDLRKKCAYPFIVVNDGSSKECDAVFEAIRCIPDCVVLKHAVNQGKGRALKTAFNYYLNAYPDGTGVVTADGDGQHAAEDVLACAEKLLENPSSLVLGVRDFSKDFVPWKSSLGNNLTKLVMSAALRCRIADTQTGLRGIPSEFMKTLLNVYGERFEFETDMLLSARDNKVAFLQFPIKTIYYDGNRATHFDPFQDSLKIYFLIARRIFGKFIAFSFNGILSSLIDIGLFALMFHVVAASWVSGRLFVSVLVARCVSMFFNYTVNKHVTFSSKDGRLVDAKSFASYFTLCVFVFCCSYFITKFLNVAFPNVEIVIVKAVVDACLFILSFLVQKNVIFADKKIPHT